ncbi:flagellar hook-length control protein FliK [Solirubrobacter soli]|uniref:flagellar hook-length control protein FliK n=1 Tax=Solirubrobacter soli TaxID=363832 RepID=UPI00041A9EAE|nr:flagellar hook-length control protein FliK [Solirubrobacter soli]
MTTDRTAAPTRSTALVTPPAGGRTPAPPNDMFSALLGAATPKSDAPARRDDTPRRDNRQRDDRPHGADDARRAKPRDDAPKAVKHADEPVADAPATPADQVPTEPAADDKPAVPTTPSLFALQLASPLPPQTATPAQTPAEAQPLPVLAGQIPASLAAATTAQATAPSELTGAVAASVAQNAPETPATATPGPIALSGLPAEATADTTLPAGLDLSKPQAQVTTTQPADSQVKPQDAQLPTTAQQQTPNDQPQDQPSAPAQQSASAPQAKPADAPAPAPTQATASPITPAAAPAMPSTPSVQRAVPLSRAIHTTGVMVHMMADKGVNHARLNLKPAELGGIEVRLRSTGDGVHALLVADSPEAARMLASAGDDLKRQLEDKNVNLLSLDVSTSDQRQEQAARFAADGGWGDDRYRPGHSNMSRSSANESALLMDAPAAADTVLVLPDGVHVDVLA